MSDDNFVSHQLTQYIKIFVLAGENACGYDLVNKSLVFWMTKELF